MSCNLGSNIVPHAKQASHEKSKHGPRCLHSDGLMIYSISNHILHSYNMGFLCISLFLESHL